MKKNLLFLFLIGLSLFGQAQSLEPKDESSLVAFKIKNFGVLVDGIFTGLKGKIIFNPSNLVTSSFDVSINSNSVNTGIDMRDNHLRKPDYFDVKQYPLIRFVSTKVEVGKNSSEYLVTGHITIKKKTIEIKIPFTALPQPDGYLFEGKFSMNRRDFNVGGSSFSMADNLLVSLKVLATGVKQ